MGFAFIPQAGIEDDEALIASSAYGGATQELKILGHNVPLMLMSYVGALKTWIFAPIFRIWRPSPTSLRVPVILIGGFTIWLFYRLLARIGTPRAAIVGCLLLSTDTVFFLTTCFDWGPVALQHMLLVSGVLCLVRFHQEDRLRFLAAGFFLFGLALWDKALFAWILTGMAIGALIVFPGELRRSFKAVNVIVATLCLCLGAAPLIFYNISFPLNTLRSSTGYSSHFLPQKISNLLSALDGHALFGYLARNDPAGLPRIPQGAIERISIQVSEATGHSRAGFFGYALFAGILIIPWLWSTPMRRPILFSAISMLVAWLQMIFTKDAGMAAHHVILLWPFPTLVVAMALAQVSGMVGRLGKPLLVTAVLFLASTNALVTNEYFATLVRNGAGIVWTDAIFPLSDYLKRVKPEVIYIDDWGIYDPLSMLSRGELPLQNGSGPLSKPHLDLLDRRVVLDRISEKGAVFVSHTAETEMLKGVNSKLEALTGEAGYRRETVAEIGDRNGRIIFDVFRFSRK